MKRKILLAALCLICASAIAAYAVPASAAQYANMRFGYTVDMPDDFEWLPEADNGDGRVFRHKAEPQFTITFYARIQQDEENDTLAEEGASRIPSGASDADELLSGPLYYASFMEDGIYTDALVCLTNGVFYSAAASWPKSVDEIYKPIAGKVLRTWKVYGYPIVY